MLRETRNAGAFFQSMSITRDRKTRGYRPRLGPLELRLYTLGLIRPQPIHSTLRSSDRSFAGTVGVPQSHHFPVAARQHSRTCGALAVCMRVIVGQDPPTSHDANASIGALLMSHWKRKTSHVTQRPIDPSPALHSPHFSRWD